jgi:hypothetical protein
MATPTICRRRTTFERVRFTIVDVCGAPVPGEDNAWVEDCTISAQATPIIETKPRIDFPRANGTSCGSYQPPPNKQGYNVIIQIWTWSPGLNTLMTGNDPIIVGTDIIGWQDCNDAVGRVAVELWHNTLSDDCEDGEVPYVYTLIPFLDNVIYNPPNAIADQPYVIQFSGNTRDGSQWGVGPWDDVVYDAGGTVEGPLPVEVGANCPVLELDTFVVPPTAACEFVEVPGS